MSLVSAIRYVEAAIKRSPGCSSGLVGQMRVLGMENGPSGGAELLATLYLDDPFLQFWYGHVLPHPSQTTYIALIARTDKFINADNVPLLLRRYHYWVLKKLEYQPCTIQADDDAYAECTNLEQAALALCRMAERFDVYKRAGLEGSVYENDPVEFRILNAYDFKSGLQNDVGPVPIPSQLKLLITAH